MMRRTRALLLAAALATSGWTSASGQAAGPPPGAPPVEAKPVQASGEILFSQRCERCHEPPIEGAPSQADLGEYDPQAVAAALRGGPMAPMAKGLSDADIDAINRYLHGG
jgi:cytochrome c5